MLAVRRDPVDRFRAACVSALVWESLRRLDRRPPVAAHESWLNATSSVPRQA